MIKIKPLEHSEILKFINFTYPKYRFSLGMDKKLNKHIAIGAFNKEEPIGLCLYHWFGKQKPAQLISLYVKEAYRQNRIGTNLYKISEDELVKKECNQIETEYIRENKQVTQFEPILDHALWQLPEKIRNVVEIHYTNLPYADWGKYYTFSDNFSLFFWKDLTPKEKKWVLLKENKPGWYEEYLCPFLIENPEPLNSLGLKHKNKIIGWIINERISLHKISYAKVFICEEFQGMGIIIKLLSESIKLQAKAEIAFGCFAIYTNNKQMNRFYERRMKPFAESINEKVKRIKKLI